MNLECNSIKTQLCAIKSNACSPYNDGWVASDSKKELVMLKHTITKLISECPNFGELEDEWEKEIILDILKKENGSK